MTRENMKDREDIEEMEDDEDDDTSFGQSFVGSLPLEYEEYEAKSLLEHINMYFGTAEFFFSGTMFEKNMRVNNYMVKAKKELAKESGIDEQYYVLTTLGVGQELMKNPSTQELSRGEFMICMPKGWRIDSEDSHSLWPVELMQTLSRLSVERGLWMGDGFTMDNGSPISNGVPYTGIMVVKADIYGNDATVCKLGKDKNINFYIIIPLYPKELEYKVQNGSDELIKKMGGVSWNSVNAGRKDSCSWKIW